jgi:hypothetical protein
MTTKFVSKEDAIRFMATVGNFKAEKVKEEPELKILGMEMLLLTSETTPEEDKEEIRSHISSQEGFSATNSRGEEILFVVSPFRDGWDCWVIDPLSGYSIRI